MNILRRFIKKMHGLYRVKTDPVAYARGLGVSIGSDCRLISIKPDKGTFGSEPYLIKIGNHVTIAGNVQFVNHDGGVWVFRDKEPDIDVFGKIVVGDNVFVGYGAIIMPSVTIGSNSVVGAGAIVTRDVPDNVVVVGAPAKVIMTKGEYYDSIKNRTENIRSYTLEDKRKYLLEKYSDAG